MVNFARTLPATGQTVPEAARLSCEECQKRKTKCNKGNPCSACKNARITCHVVHRARLPRGRSSKIPNKKKLLESRVARLEGLMKQLEVQLPDGSDGGIVSQMESGTSSGRQLRPGGKMNGLVSRDFWMALCQEVSGLRETIEDSEDEDNVQSLAVSVPVKAAPDNDGSASILFEQAWRRNDTSALRNPPTRIRDVLFGIYRERVDPVFKVLHLSTVVEAIEKEYCHSQDAVQSPATQALEFAIYFMAMCSITDGEADAMVLGGRASLVQRYRVATETLIFRADLYQNPDLTVLQAFVIYLLGLRTCRNIETMWVLTAVAARVGTARGLGPNDSDQWPRYDLEVRRRLWSSIGVLDTLAALDRGSVPLLQWEEFQHPPSNIDDSEPLNDFVPRPSSPLSPRLTDMDFACFEYDAMVCQKRICGPPFIGEAGRVDAWNEKLRIISDFEDSIKRRYFWVDDSAPPFARFSRFIAEAIALNMQLLLRRPPFRTKHNPVPFWDEFHLMDVVTSLLEKSLQKRDEDVFSPWAWFTHQKWYALAILLVELSVCEAVALTDRAFSVASACFDHYAPLLSDTDSGLFWRPLAKLMRRVQNRKLDIEKSMGSVHGTVELESSNAQGIKTLRTGRLRDQPPLMSQQVAPTRIGIPPSEVVHDPSETNVISDDGMAWINWDLFLADLNTSAALR